MWCNAHGLLRSAEPERARTPQTWRRSELLVAARLFRLAAGLSVALDDALHRAVLATDQAEPLASA